MATRKKTVLGGSGSSNGEPVAIDYREMLRALAPATSGAAGEYATAEEIAELVGLSRVWISQQMLKARRARRVGFCRVRSAGGGPPSFAYRLKDVLEELKK